MKSLKRGRPYAGAGHQASLAHHHEQATTARPAKHFGKQPIRRHPAGPRRTYGGL